MDSPAKASTTYDLVHRYAALWDRSGPPPDLVSFLKQHPEANVEQRAAVVQVDQTCRWRNGLGRPVEEYLDEFPEVAKDNRFVLQLVVQEFIYLSSRERGPDAITFLRRFPDLPESRFHEILHSVETVDAREGCASPGSRSKKPEYSHALSIASAKKPASGATNPFDDSVEFGRYKVIRPLGQGSFGKVYLARDDELERPVAIKVPHRETIRRPEIAQSYLAEARLVARLDHPGIVPVFDLGKTEDGRVFIVSKFVDGSDLATTMKGRRPSAAVSAEWVAAIAEALHFAHKQGLVHRDIKPANILVDSRGMPYLADFGIALKNQNDGRLGELIGSPAYMSPEQVRGDTHSMDGRSDIFSLGIVFYEMLTGTRPFQGDTCEELIGRIETMEARAPRQIVDSVPPELDRICLKCLSKRATDRPTTAADLAAELRAFLRANHLEPTVAPDAAEHPAEVPATHREFVSRASFPSRTWGRQWLLVSAVMLLFVAVAVHCVTLTRRCPEPTRDHFGSCDVPNCATDVVSRWRHYTACP